MSKVRPKRRRFEIKKRQERRKKLAKLRELYSKTKSKKEREKILEKVAKIAPYLSEEEFLAPKRAKSNSGKQPKFTP